MANYSTLDDEELVELIRDRDAAALEAVYDRLARQVFSLAVKMLADAAIAEEVVQEVFVKLWRQPERYIAGRGKLRTWLLGVTHNRAVDELRSRRAELSRQGGRDDGLHALALADSGPGPAELAWISVQQDAVRRALATLPPDQRTAIELAYFKGMTHSEIADHLREPLGTIKTRVRLAMQKLRIALEAERIWAGMP